MSQFFCAQSSSYSSKFTSAWQSDGFILLHAVVNEGNKIAQCDFSPVQRYVESLKFNFEIDTKSIGLLVTSFRFLGHFCYLLIDFCYLLRHL